MYEVHVAPELWENTDVPGKKEIMSAIMIYMEEIQDHDFNSIDFKDKNTDREIGSWSTLSGFEIKN